jgi:hypothetical protein
MTGARSPLEETFLGFVGGVIISALRWLNVETTLYCYHTTRSDTADLGIRDGEADVTKKQGKNRRRRLKAALRKDGLSKVAELVFDRIMPTLRRIAEDSGPSLSAPLLGSQRG